MSGTVRDSLHVIDVVHNQDGGQRPDIIVTDTASYSDLVFGPLHLLGYSYRPASPKQYTSLTTKSGKFSLCTSLRSKGFHRRDAFDRERSCGRTLSAEAPDLSIEYFKLRTPPPPPIFDEVMLEDAPDDNARVQSNVE